MLPEDEIDGPDPIEVEDGANDQGQTGYDEPPVDEIDDHEGQAGEDDQGDDGSSNDDAGNVRAQESASQVGQKRESDYARLRRLRREADERAERAEREIRELRQQSQQQPRRSQQEIAAERQARLDLMSPEEQTRFLVDEARNEARNEIQQIRFEQADSRDASRYDSLCARDPVAAKYADEVERELINLRRNGGNSTRETILNYLVGKYARDRAGTAKKEQGDRGKSNLKRQQARPGNSGSTVVGQGERRATNERAARAKRLDGIVF